MRIEVIYSVWGADGTDYPGGVHEIAKPTAKLLKLAAAAEAAGVVRVTASKDERTKMRTHVESQSDSEAAYAKAQESGAWQEANVAQHLMDVAQGAPTGSVG